MNDYFNLTDEQMVIAHELSDFLCGDLRKDNDGSLYIEVYTGDCTSKENYDELISLRDDMEIIIDEIFIIDDMWADHDTQIVEISLK